MKNFNIIIYVLNFFLIIFVQIYFFQDFTIINKSVFCFMYVVFILQLPLDIDKSLLMLIGFITGLSVGIPSNGAGIHSFSCVLIAFLRPILLDYITPLGGYEVGAKPTVSSLGLSWYAKYAFPLVFIHSLSFLIVEGANTSIILSTIPRALGTAVFTFIILLIIQPIFYSKKKR